MAKRWLWAVLVVLAGGGAVHAQTGFTQVSGTVVDRNGSIYSNAVFNVGFVNPGTPAGILPLLNGSTFQQQYVGVVTDSFGRFQMALPDNNVIATSSGALGTQWNFSFCSVLYPSTNQRYCFNLTLSVSGASMNISSQLTAASATLPVPGGTGISGTANSGQVVVGNGVNSVASYPEFVYSHASGDLNVPIINGIIQIDGVTYPCSAIGLSAAIIAAGAQGVVDARGCNPSSTILSVISIPANVTVYLGPYVWTCGVSSGPCFSLTGQGARLIGTLGTNAGNAMGSGPGWPGSQSGTIIRMNTSLIGATTDAVAINPNPAQYAGTGGFEVGDLTIDFNNAGSAYGRYCLAAYSMMRSHIHDISCFNPGVNGFEFENTENGWSYDDTLERVFVRQAPQIAFNWTTVPGGGFADMDRWTITNAYDNPSDANSANYMGTIGFHLATGGVVSQSIADFTFTNIWVGGGAPGGANNGIEIDQGGLAYIENINLEGEIESLGSVGGTALEVSSASVSLLVGVDFKGLFYNYATETNMSPTTMQAFSHRGLESSLNTFQGLLIDQAPAPSTPGCPTTGRNNLSGIFFPTSNGCYDWVTESDGILRVWRVDTGPTELWRFDMPNDRFDPATDNTGSLGISSNRWASGSFVQLNIASVASLTTTGATSDNVTVTGATSSSHCGLTATNASAATNLPTTYISAKAANQITVTHTATSGMTYDVVCTGD